MTTLVKRFSLSSSGDGIACGEAGLAVGSVSLLTWIDGLGWTVRPAAEINSELTAVYGVPTRIDGKTRALVSVAKALNEGDIARAQITALHLQLPDPPISPSSGREDAMLIRSLQETGLLKWDTEKHPRWPAGSPDSVGGEFAPAGEGGGSADAPERDSAPKRVQAQVAIPFPGEGGDVEAPEGFPIPWGEIAPPIPLTPPNSIPYNPYPRRQKCVKEWAPAYEYCERLLKKKRFGKDGYRGVGGKNYDKCLLGQVSQDCGGNAVEVWA